VRCKQDSEAQVSTPPRPRTPGFRRSASPRYSDKIILKTTSTFLPIATPTPCSTAGLGVTGMIPGVGAAGINPAALAAAGIPGNAAPPSPKVEKKPPKRAPAPKTKAPANKKTSPAPAKKGVKREASADPSDKASDDDFSDSEGGEGEGGKGKTTDEVRRQRRMLSNRESARRSRRRKLEHVATLEGQINQHKAENLALLERLRESDARVEAVVRENAQLKAEIVRMSEVAGAGGKPMERASSLQRIASAGNLAKSNLGGTASPQMSGDDSPRGFVPFRSLQSYENLLSLQAQGR